MEFNTTPVCDIMTRIEQVHTLDIDARLDYDTMVRTDRHMHTLSATPNPTCAPFNKDQSLHILLFFYLSFQF